MQFDDTNRGVLFRNDRKAKPEDRAEGAPEDRDFSGSLNVDGVEYWLSAWLRTSKNGRKFLSLSIKPKADPVATGTSTSASRDLDDFIP